ncbi:hypothetical protein [Rhizobium leguminosarum]|uniref:hypothetical protein n=1 Tax=Rhizobium leguminosarum TaxID=384 RepID=UPI0010312F29|nr:hypothetical protein [Rhizobium leguminosarum]TBG70858.1 hypothetical protein ELG74_24650 [Rhizobium leguminosarum]
MTPLLSLYGERFCNSFSRAWRSAFSDGFSEVTSYKYFATTVKALSWIAVVALDRPKGAEARFYAACQRGRPNFLSRNDIEECLGNIFDSLIDKDDQSLRKAGTPKSINTMMDGLKSTFSHLANVGFFPFHTFSARVFDGQGARTPSIATLLIDAGKLDLDEMGAEAAAEVFATKNVESLDALRAALCKEFENEWRAFERGCQLLTDSKIPSGEETIEILKKYGPTEVINIKDWLVGRLGLDEDQYIGLVARLVRDINLKIFHIHKKKYNRLVASVGGHDVIQRLIMPNSIALNAAYHIVIIDTLLNDGSVAQLPADIFTGLVKRGNVEIHTVSANKNRKNGHRKNVVTAAVASDMGTIDSPTMFVTGKFKNQTPFKTVIQRWLTMTDIIRRNPRMKKSHEDRLWVYQRAGQQVVRTNMQSVGAYWWPAFLVRLSRHPMLGGLRLTRMVIRKTGLNKKAELDDLQYAINTAMGNHAKGHMPFYYMDELGIKATLASLIRTFLDQWEAVAVRGISSAAKVLGITESDLSRRFQLGLKAGLDFADVSSDGGLEFLTNENVSPCLADDMRLLPIDDTSMEQLELARRTLDAKMADMLHVNPERFVRVWLPWVAIVHVYADKLKSSRFSLAFAEICSKVDNGLRTGSLRLLYIW